MQLRLSPDNPNTRDAWNQAFGADGDWRKNAGRTQTALFARCFHQHIRVPFSGAFSVLDVGCALGDALPVWKERFPAATLQGCDVSEVAIEEARRLHGGIASFSVASFEEITGHHDVIFCSNVLEHFEQYLDIARLLLSHCDTLYVMTPFAERDRLGRPLVPTPGEQHVATFLEDSFAPLEREGVARISTAVVRCPVAWSPTWRHELLWHLRFLLGSLTDPSPPRRQLIYTLVAAPRSPGGSVA